MSSVPTLGVCNVPAFGFGTYELRGAACTEAVRYALQLGFRLLDTATGYRNEELVGAGIRESGVPREEIFVVVKVSPRSVTSEEAVEIAVRDSVGKLGIGYADAVLLHWPGGGGLQPGDAEGHQRARRRAYTTLQRLQAEGLARWLGVSNFLPRHFRVVEEVCEWDGASASPPPCSFPVLNQIELHPLCVQSDAVGYGRARGVVPQQYSPLGQGHRDLLEHPMLAQLVSEHFPGRMRASVLCMWGLSQGYCTLVRSSNPTHIKENWQAGQDFFASVVDTPSATGGLTEQQHAVLRDLRELMHVTDAPDTHFCWYSSEIA